MAQLQSTMRNRVLSGLSPEDFAIVEPDLRRISLTLRQSVERPNEPIVAVFFPENCVMSLVAGRADGEKIEVGMIGREGMTALAVVNENGRSPHECFVQVAGEAHTASADDLRRWIQTSSTVMRRFLRYSQTMALQVAYTALANGRSSLDERLARWLLMCHDRVEADEFPLTHEFVSVMLGVRRAGVTEAMQALEGAKMIEASRGTVTIANRRALEQRAGEAYGTPEREYERLMA
jgi:CRP-like cAMP-binding protein